MLTLISADIMEKLKILSDAAKFDVACTSSGTSRLGNGKDMGSTFASGICHSFTADGRCISLLKILLQMNVFMIAGTVSTDALMMLKESHLHLRRYVSSPLSFTDAII